MGSEGTQVKRSRNCKLGQIVLPKKWPRKTALYKQLTGIILAITKGFGVRATTIEGQNTFAQSLYFA